MFFDENLVVGKSDILITARFSALEFYLVNVYN